MLKISTATSGVIETMVFPVKVCGEAEDIGEGN